MKIPDPKTTAARWLASSLALAIVAAFLASADADEDRAPATVYVAASETDELAAREGRKTVVHGVVSGSGTSASGTNFVNFGNAAFSLVTFKSDLGPFGEIEPAELYEGKRIAVEGIVSIFQGKPQIKLTDPEQVTLLEPDAVFPPPVETAAVAPTDSAEAASKMESEHPETPEAPEPKRKPPVDPSEYFDIKPKPRP